MVIIYTENNDFNEELNKVLEEKKINSRIAYYPEYLLTEDEASCVIISPQQNKYDFTSFLYNIRMKNIRIILLLENTIQNEYKIALTMGIYDIVCNPLWIKDVIEVLENPRTFKDIGKEFKEKILGGEIN